MKEIRRLASTTSVAQIAPANELYDFVDDDTIENYNKYEEKQKTIDYDLLEKRKLPVFPEEKMMDYIVDDEDERSLRETTEEEIEQQDVNKAPLEMTDEETPDFANATDALRWAIDEDKVVRINYQTKKGIDITRIVEPHAIFTAGETGNPIVVTYDRSARGVRAFIINNILNYIFTGKEFKKRMRVMPLNNKENEIMENNIFASLRDIGNDLDKKGLKKSGKVVTGVMEGLLEVKKAQYVGIQGYWLRNRRCWDNCYRHKRATEPDKAAQTVWMDCWEEYNASINNDKSGWEKYASGKKIVKTAERDLFTKKVSQKIKDGISHGEAIYSASNEDVFEQESKLLKNAAVLADLAEILVKTGHEEIGLKVSMASLDLLKEAQPASPFEGETGMGTARGGWISRALNAIFGGGEKNMSNSVLARLRSISQKALDIANDFNLISQQQVAPVQQKQQVDPVQQQQLTSDSQQDEIKTSQMRMPGQAMPQQSASPFRDKAVSVLNKFNTFIQGLGQEQALLGEISNKTKNQKIKGIVDSGRQSIMQFLQTPEITNIFNQIKSNPDYASLLQQAGPNVTTALSNLGNSVLGGAQESLNLPADTVDPASPEAQQGGRTDLLTEHEQLSKEEGTPGAAPGAAPGETTPGAADIYGLEKMLEPELKTLQQLVVDELAKFGPTQSEKGRFSGRGRRPSVSTKPTGTPSTFGQSKNKLK